MTDAERDAFKEQAATYRLLFGITTAIVVSIVAWLIEKGLAANVPTFIAVGLTGFLSACGVHILYVLNRIVRRLKAEP